MAATAAEPAADPADRRRAVRPLEDPPCPRDVGGGLACFGHSCEQDRVDQCKPLLPVRNALQSFVQSMQGAGHDVVQGEDTVRELVHG